MKYEKSLDLRSLQFAKNTSIFCRSGKISIFDKIYIVQLLRSSASIGANYREANNALSYLDFKYRIRISRKEAKETIYWLELLENYGDSKQRENLISEAIELVKIFSAIIKNKQKIDDEF